MPQINNSLGLEEVPLSLAVPGGGDGARLDVLGQPALQRLRDHRQLVALVRSFREAFQGRGLDDGLAEGDYGVGHCGRLGELVKNEVFFLCHIGLIRHF